MSDPIKKVKLDRLKKLLEEEKLKKTKTFEDKLKKQLEENQTKKQDSNQQPNHRSELDEKITTNKDGISFNEEGNPVLKNKQGIYEEVKHKSQPTISQDNRSKKEIFKSHKESDDKYKSDEFKKSLKNNVLKPVKVATDIASLGAFVPHPIAQEVAFLGRGLGATIDGYELTEDIKNKDYGSALINTAGLVLPMMTGSKTFMRNSKYSKHKQNLDNFLGDYGRTNYINTASRVRKQSQEALNANRVLLGLSGAELAYDINNFANGGNLQQQTNNNNNMLNEFNEGGTHESNPLGGIPMGQGSNGNQNVVEQGETMKDKFVYSNRITLTPEIISKYNLPKSLVGKTVADATKLIDKKFEGRNDKIDLSTKKNFLDRIGEAQENIKADEQAQIQASMQVNSQEVPDMMEGQIPQGMDQFMQESQDHNSFFAGGNISMMNNPENQNAMGMMPGIGGAANAGQTANASNTSGTSNGGGMAAMGNALGGIGTALSPGGTFAKNKIAAEKEGFHDSKFEKDQKMEQTSEGVKDSVSGALGPFGQLFRGIQKAGKGMGDSIGGESGAAVSGAFSPEEGTMSNLTNEDLSAGEKVLGTVPGLGGVIAHRSAKKRLDKFMDEKRKGEYFEKYVRPTENYSGVETFADGGNLGDSDPTDPKTTETSTLTGPIKNYNNSTLQRINKVSGVQFTPEGASNTFKTRTPETSKYKDILKIQEGVNDPKLGEGVYYWYGQPGKTAGFNVEGDRDFVTMENHNKMQRSLDPNFKNEKVNKYYQTAGKNKGSFVSYAKGGQLNQNRYDGGGPFDENSVTNPQDHTKGGYSVQPNPWKDQFQANLDYAKQADANNTEGVRQSGYQGLRNLKEKIGNGLNKAGDWMDKNGGSTLRYAPIAMNAFQLGNLGGPEVEKLDRLNNQYQKQFLDEKTLQNQVAQQAAAANNAIGRSGISGGQLINAQLATQLNATKGMSDAYSKIKEHNMNENKLAQQTQFGNNSANISQSNLEKDINARNRGAHTTEKSKLLGQMGNDLGNVGKEEVYKNLARETFGYTWDGKYYKSKDGSKLTKAEMESKIDNDEKSKGYAQRFKMMKDRQNFEPLTFNKNKQ